MQKNEVRILAQPLARPPTHAAPSHRPRNAGKPGALGSALYAFKYRAAAVSAFLLTEQYGFDVRLIVLENDRQDRTEVSDRKSKGIANKYTKV
jgi:hypothetical protein